MPHVGYWYGSGLEPEGILSYQRTSLRVAEERIVSVMVVMHVWERSLAHAHTDVVVRPTDVVVRPTDG